MSSGERTYTARVIAAVLLVLLLLAAAPAASAHQPPTSPLARTAAVDQPCPGAAIKADKVITGSFPASMQGSYVMVPFTVPFGTTAVRVKYCFDQPENPVSSQQVRHTLDLGVFDARVGDELWGASHFRGWGGSSHPDVWISPEGFSDEATYKQDPRGNVAGKTTRGFMPGPIQPGVWAAELGLAAIADQSLGDSDGAVGWRLELAFPTDKSFADERYRPARYDERPARSEPGWYAGDFHVHAEHSALGDATMTETFDYSFGEAELDFITLSDYVTKSGWGEIGRHQGRYPGKLVTRSSEIITYRGHTNNQTSVAYVDHRRGPVWELKPDGSLEARREALPPSGIFEAVHAAGGWTQVNHPTIFPSDVPGFQMLCRGCPWDYTDAETDWKQVDAYEVHTGPGGIPVDLLAGPIGPNPFTPAAVAEYERLLAEGHHIAAVAASDSHRAGRTDNPTQAPIGEGQSVVYAQELSEAGVRCAVQAGHTYAKVGGSGRPDLRMEARAPGVQGAAIFGDTLRAGGAELKISVLDGAPDRQLLVLRDGAVWQTLPGEGEHTLAVPGPGRYGLRLMRGTTFEAVSTPIWIEDPGAAAPSLVSRDCSVSAYRSPAPGPRLSLRAGRTLKVRKGAVVVRCRMVRGSARRCRVAAHRGPTVLARGRAPFRKGRATVRVSLTRQGRAALRGGPKRVRLLGRANSGAAVALATRAARLKR
jgi:hypothetical protein